MTDLIKKHLSLRLFASVCIFLAVGAALFLYITFQARLLILGPSITLQSEPDTVQHERTVTIAGTARNIVSLSLNDRAIFTDDSGNFSETLVLPDGYTIMTLRAEDRYGRETVYTRPFVHTPLF